MTALSKATLQRLWPGASQPLINACVAKSDEVFARYHINTPLRVAHFMAQISHESDGGRIKEESLNYTTAARIAQVWPTRFTPESAAAYVRNPQELGNKVYNGRMGNRPGTNDGFNFRGRGLLQITGRESYARIGSLTNLDLVNNPSLVNDPANALEIAACEFQDLKCLPACDADDIRTVTKRVNGGYIGIDSRRAWLSKWKLALPELPGQLPTAVADIDQLSDTQLPRQADGDPAKKTMAESTEGWAAIVTTITGISTAVGQFFDSLKPLLANPATITILAVVAICAGGYLFWRRRQRLIEDHV